MDNDETLKEVKPIRELEKRIAEIKYRVAVLHIIAIALSIAAMIFQYIPVVPELSIVFLMILVIVLIFGLMQN